MSSSSGYLLDLAEEYLRGGNGKQLDVRKAVELYLQLIFQKYIPANCGLAYLLEKGTEGLSKDAPKAKELYKCAIKEDNHVPSMNGFGRLLLYGAEGVKKDAPRAKRYFERAISEGESASAMNNLGNLLVKGAEGVEKDVVKAKELFEWAIAKEGHVNAMNNLAFLLEKGGPSIPKDAVRAKILYETAIDKGQHLPAMNNLGRLLENGADGVPRDFKRAIDLYKKAGERNYTPAINNLVRLGTSCKTEDFLSPSNVNNVGQNLNLVDQDEKQTQWAKYDIFISHACTEKESVAVPLRNYLERKGLNCFLDTESLRWSSETLPEQIKRAIKKSKMAVFILTPVFAARKWPMLEVLEFQKIHEKRRSRGSENKAPVFIPLFYTLSHDQCCDKDLPNHRNYQKTFQEHGFFETDRQVDIPMLTAIGALQKLAEFRGVCNERGLVGEEFARYAGRRIMKY